MLYPLVWAIVIHFATANANVLALPYAFQSAEACGVMATVIQRKTPKEKIGCIEMRVVALPDRSDGRHPAR